MSAEVTDRKTTEFRLFLASGTNLEISSHTG